MNKILIALTMAVLIAGSAVASDKTDVMVPVNQFMVAFNKGDIKGLEAVCTDQMSIIDEFPPHEWHGAGAVTQWMNDYDADAKKNEITDGVVSLGKPKHIDVAGDRAYVVVPANYTFKKKGKPVKETGSMFTLSLQKVEAGWRITGWAWAKN